MAQGVPLVQVVSVADILLGVPPVESVLLVLLFLVALESFVTLEYVPS